MAENLKAWAKIAKLGNPQPIAVPTPPGPGFNDPAVILHQVYQTNAQVISRLDKLIEIIGGSEEQETTNPGLLIAPGPRTFPNAKQPLTPTSLQTYDLETSETPNDPEELPLRGTVLWMILDNSVPGNQEISISFDGGTNYKTILAGAVLNLVYPFSLPENLTSFLHKSASAAAPFELLTGEF